MSLLYIHFAMFYFTGLYNAVEMSSTDDRLIDMNSNEKAKQVQKTRLSVHIDISIYGKPPSLWV